MADPRRSEARICAAGTSISYRIAQNPEFALKARRVAGRHLARYTGRRIAWSRPSIHGVVRMVLALWCIAIAVVAAQGPTAQAQIVAQLEERAPVLAVIAAPDPLTRGAVSLPYRASDWARDLKQVL